MKKNIKLLIFLLLITPWMVSLKNDAVTTIENFNSNLLRESSTSLTGDLNYMSEGDYIFESLTWAGESLFNVTCSSTGSAELFFYFTSTINRYSYYNNKDTSVWSDDFLMTYGKPLWVGANWNTWTLNDDINSGVEVIAGNRKSFLLSLGNGDSFDVRVYILLKQTLNSSQNSYKIEIVNLLDSNIIESIEIGNQNTTHFSVPSNGFKLFKFESSITSNEVVLSNEIKVNNSFSWIYWHDTLTNIWSPLKESFTENVSREWVPIFNNFDLTGRPALGIIFNSAGTDLNFTYSSRLALESSNRIEKVTYSESSMFSTKFLFNDTMKDAYFILEMNDRCFFDMVFQIDLNWSVSVDFYSLGTNHGQKEVINKQGTNGDEKLSIFYAPTSNLYQDRDTATFIEQESYGVGWYGINGSLNPEVKKINKISSLIGFQINAKNNGTNPEANITVQIIPRNIASFSSGEEVGIGKTDAGLETPTFPFLQVRQFDTVNWRRYQWELQAYNQTKLLENSYWFCGVEGSNYVNNMNNSLYSPKINNTNNYVDLTLEVKISYELSRVFGNDIFSIYIKNDTDRELLDEYIGNSEGEITYSRDISNWIGRNFTIEFNLFTNSMGDDKGITVDDFMIKGNSSLIIYENDFESNLAGWTHIDHSGEGDLWHIAMEEVGVNKPIVDVVYQESIYSMEGEKPSLIGIGTYPRIFFDKDPKAQPIPMSYLVYYAEGPIENNFSIKLSVNSFDLVSITNNQIKFTNDFTYEEAEQQGAEVINSTKVLNRPRWYYKINNVVDLHQLIIELSENSILQEHSSINIAFYDQYGQSPFTVSCLELNTLNLGLSLLRQVRASGAIIISITDLTYNDYIELNIYDNPYDTNSPTVDFELGTQSIPLRMVNDQIKFNLSISDTGGRSINIESLKFYLVEGLDSIANWNDSSLKEISPTYNVISDTGQNVKIKVIISNITLSVEKYYQLLIYIEDTESPPNINSPNDASIVIIGSTISNGMPLIVITIILIITSVALGALGFLIYRKYSTISKEYSSLKISYDIMQKKSKMKPSLDRENAKKPPFSPPIDSNNK